MTDKLYLIWNFLDDKPVNFNNRIAFTREEDAQDHLTDYMYGGLPVFKDELMFKQEWLDVVDTAQTDDMGNSFGEKLLGYYIS
jgi:hypothetical protein